MRVDRQTDMTKLIVAFRNIANFSKNYQTLLSINWRYFSPSNLRKVVLCERIASKDAVSPSSHLFHMG